MLKMKQKTNQERINANRALEQTLKDKNKGFPKFKNLKPFV